MAAVSLPAFSHPAAFVSRGLSQPASGAHSADREAEALAPPWLVAAVVDSTGGQPAEPIALAVRQAALCDQPAPEDSYWCRAPADDCHGMPAAGYWLVARHCPHLAG